MISDEVRLDYEVKIREELKLSISFAKNAKKELNRGNYKVALTQAMEAEKHIGDAKGLLRSMNQLNEMERLNTSLKKEIKFAVEFNEQNRQLEELEIQLEQVKNMAAKASEPETITDDEEFKIKV